MSIALEHTEAASGGGWLDNRQADFAFAATVALAVLVTALLYAVFSHIVAVLLISALLSYALLPVVNRLATEMPRWIAVALVTLAALGLLVLVFVLALPAAGRELQNLGAVVTQVQQVVQQMWSALLSWLPGPVSTWLSRLANSLFQSAGGGGPSPGTLAAWARTAGSGVASVATGILFVPIFVIVMLRNLPRLASAAVTAVPPRWRDRFTERLQQLDQVLAGFIRGQLLVALIIAFMYVTAFVIIGIPLAILVGLLAGLGELVPYLGGAIALVLGILMALAGGQPLDALWVTVVFAAVQGLEGSVISPMIVGRHAKLGAGTVIVALAIGGQLFGIIGLLVAVPAAAMLKVAAAAAVDGYRQTDFYRRRALVPTAPPDL